MSLLNPDDPFNPSASRAMSEPGRVVITDIDMTIGGMCRFMVKWAIASIPAAIILFVIWFIVSGAIAALLRS